MRQPLDARGATEFSEAQGLVVCRMPDETVAQLTERIEDQEVRLAFQDRLIRDLDALVREFGDRLDKLQRELDQLKQSIRSPETPMGPANEPPPHY
jgi:uncharacterized coiled-coil protein SlyX